MDKNTKHSEETVVSQGKMVKPELRHRPDCQDEYFETTQQLIRHNLSLAEEVRFTINSRSWKGTRVGSHWLVTDGYGGYLVNPIHAHCSCQRFIDQQWAQVGKGCDHSNGLRNALLRSIKP